jgi:hypothetical protein
MSGQTQTLYVWLGSEPDIAEPDAGIDDVPGERDLDLIAAAIRDGTLGRYLPVRISYAPRDAPNRGQWKSIDTARLLRDYGVRHRRRYEVMLEASDESVVREPGEDD